MCLPIGSMLLRSKILWMKHVVFWREPDGVIPRATGDWLTGRWDSRKVLRHCHNTWKTSTYARRCWSSRFWHSDWKSGLFPDFYRKYSKVRTFPGPGGQQLKIRTFPGNKDPWEPWFDDVIMFTFSLADLASLSTKLYVRGTLLYPLNGKLFRIATSLCHYSLAGIQESANAAIVLSVTNRTNTNKHTVCPKI